MFGADPKALAHTSTAAPPPKTSGLFHFRYRPQEVVRTYVEHKVLTIGDLSPDQRSVFATIERWIKGRGPLLTLGGYAGTGKSTLVSLLAYSYPLKRIAFCALTGKAAGVLRQKLFATGAPPHGHWVGTLHSLIYFPIVDDKTGDVTHWGRKSELDFDFIVVDEASMIDEHLFKDLESFGLPILAVGDHGQLPPVMGNFNLMEEPDIKLERIHRQAESSPILQLSATIRQTGDLPLQLRSNEKITYVESRKLDTLLQEIHEERATLLKAHQNLGGKDLRIEAPVVLCYTNWKRQNINRRVREICHPGMSLDLPLVGEHVVCLKNFDGTVFNGMRGEVVSANALPHDPLRIQAKILFPDDDLEFEGPICKPQLGRTGTFKNWEEIKAELGVEVKSWDAVGLLFDYGYALTVHKAQGSGFERMVIFYERPQTLSRDDFRRWLYTAVTRCSNRLTIVVD